MLRAFVASVASIYAVFWFNGSEAGFVSDAWIPVGMALALLCGIYAAYIMLGTSRFQQYATGFFALVIWLPVIYLSETQRGIEWLQWILTPYVGIPVLLVLCGLLLGFNGLTNIRHMFRRRVFGGARWAKYKELRNNGLTQTGGLFLGTSNGHDLYHSDEGHLITIGGTGGGKSSGLVVPALLNLTHGSIVVTDPSGEIAAMTKRHRATVSKVVILNPFQSIFEEGTGLDYPDTGFNPLSIINPDRATFKSDCDAVARYLMVTDRKESGTYWNDEGKELLSLIIGATVLYEADDLKNLTFVYQRARDSTESFGSWLEYISEQGHPALCDEAERFISIILDAPQQWAGIASKAALATKRYAPSTPLGEHVRKDGFNALDLKREDVTVYILVPPEQLENALPWMNMIIGIFGMAIGRPGDARTVTLLIDEAPSLGYIPDLQPFMAQFRKVGLRVWIFTQTVAHMSREDLYGKTGFEAIFGLCTIKQFFAISEPQTAKAISDLCGEKTAVNVSANTGGASLGDVGVPLIRPEAVRGLKKWSQIIVKDGMINPIQAKLTPYFKRADWRKMTDENPYQ